MFSSHAIWWAPVRQAAGKGLPPCARDQRPNVLQELPLHCELELANGPYTSSQGLATTFSSLAGGLTLTGSSHPRIGHWLPARFCPSCISPMAASVGIWGLLH